MNFITQFVPETFIKALGWTLLHSLWQGAVVTLLVGLLLIVLKRHSAMLRYFTVATALATIFVMSIATFYRYYSTGVSTSGTTSGRQVMRAAGYPVMLEMTGVKVNPTTTPRHTFISTEAFADYFEHHFPLIVTIWFVGILALTLRLLGGLAYVQRLKHYKTKVAASQWQSRLDALQQKIQMSRPVQLLESALVKVPMVIGYLKPVILFPIGTFTGLPTVQVEALIAHELAHIYRNDYLINLLQSFIEIIFFYHPAVWWLSAQVRQEREHCCDDIAITLCGDSITFAKALATLEELQWQSPRLAMAATGSNGLLLGRVKRLLTGTKRTPSFAEGFLAACVLLIGVAAVSVSAEGSVDMKFQPVSNRKTASLLAQTVPDLFYTTPASSQEKIATGERQAYYLQLKDSTNRKTDVIIVKDKKGNIIELYVDGKRIPDDKIKDYQNRINESLQAQKKAKSTYSNQPDKDLSRAITTIDQAQDKSDAYVSPTPPVPPMPAVNPTPPLAPMAPLSPMPAAPPAPPAPPANYNDEKAMKAYGKAMKIYEEANEAYARKVEEVAQAYAKAHEETMEANVHRHESLARKQEVQARQHANEMRRRSEEMRRRSERIRAEVERRQEIQMQQQEARQREHEARQKEHEARQLEHEKRMREHEAQMKIQREKHEKFRKILKAELHKDGFSTENEFELELRKNSLEINGKKQSDELYQKYKKLVEENTGTNVDKFGETSRFQINWNK